MQSARLPENEKQRLQSLRDLEILDTLPEEAYDDITKLATAICGTPTALITLVDEKRQWFKSKQGLGIPETPRDTAFCAHTIVHQADVMVIPDARYDERFHDNPLVTGDPHVIFYAGVPLKNSEGHALGSICVIDSRPRDLSDEKIEALKALAKLVTVHFELRKTNIRHRKSDDIIQTLELSLPRINGELNSIRKEKLSSEQERSVKSISEVMSTLSSKL